MRHLVLLATLVPSVAAATPLPPPARRCLTPEMLPLVDAVPFAGLARPPSAGFVDSTLYPVRVHYRLPADRARAETVVLPAVETAYAVEVDQMGWPSPPPDGGAGGTDAYDFYLTNAGTAGGAYTYGFGPDVIPGDTWYSVPTFIALDDVWITDADMPGFVAHEFNHALQYTIDAHERTIFAWESTAEAITDIVFDATDYGYELPSFQQLPFASLLFDSYSPELRFDLYGYVPWYYEYGGMLFATFLEEHYGTKDGTTLLRMWDTMGQADPRADEPDFLDALALLDPADPSAAEVYTEFAVWRMFAATDDDGAHYEEAASWGPYAVVASEATIPLSTLDGTVVTPSYEPYELGTSYWRIDLEGGTSQWLHLDVAGDPAASWGVAWAVWPASGPARTGTALASPGQPLLVDLDLSGGVKAQVGIVNAGAPTLDANDRNLPRRTFTATFSLVDPPPPVETGDTGLPALHTGDTTPTTTTTDGTSPEHTGAPQDTDTVPTDDPAGQTSDDGGGAGGCGCGTSPAGLPLVLLAPLLVAIRRRSRS